jgi:hypothetical protein
LNDREFAEPFFSDVPRQNDLGNQRDDLRLNDTEGGPGYVAEGTSDLHVLDDLVDDLPHSGNQER